MPEIKPTPQRLALMRAAKTGSLTASRDGAMHLHCHFDGRSVRGAIQRLAFAKLVDIGGFGYGDRPVKLTDAGREWLAVHDTTEKG
jgi:hypothetical protein